MSSGGWLRRSGRAWWLALVMAGSGCVLSRPPLSTPKPLEEPADPLAGQTRMVERPAPTSQAPRRRAAAPSGLRFKVDPPDAAIRINGILHGCADRVLGPDGSVPLPPGLYRIVVERHGRQTWRGEVTVDNQLVPIEVSLPQAE